MFNIIEIFKSENEDTLILIDILSDICSKLTLTCIANMFPLMYANGSISKATIFSRFLTSFGSFMDRKFIIDLITVIISTKMLQYTKYYNLNRYSKNVDQLDLDDGSFPIDKLMIINKFFPNVLKQFISKFFTSYMCIFRLNDKLYDNEFKMNLIKYTQIFNEWGHLPYAIICNRFISKSHDIVLCPICQHETIMKFNKCKHPLCEYCLVANLYSEKYINKDLDKISTLCTICRIIKNINKNDQ